MTEQEVLGIIRKEREQNGPGCFGMLVTFIYWIIVLVFLIGVEFRLLDLEDKTGLDHRRDVFDEQYWKRLGP